MTTSAATVVGRGSANSALSMDDLSGIVRSALAEIRAGARVLAIIPDRTRDDITPALFPLISQELARRGAVRFDALVAQGTHAPMGDADKRAKIGWGPAALPLFGDVFDHHWDRPESLQTIGTLPAGRVSALT